MNESVYISKSFTCQSLQSGGNFDTGEKLPFGGTGNLKTRGSQRDVAYLG
jgi:hypothetical protein